MSKDSSSAADRGSEFSAGLGAWVETDKMLPPEGVEVFATGWAYQDKVHGRYFRWWCTRAMTTGLTPTT